MLIAVFQREEVEQLYNEHAAALVVFACAILGDRARAQDVVHKVFLRLIDRPPGVPQDRSAYLFAAVRKTALNELRRDPHTVELDEGHAWFDAEGHDLVGERNLRHALWNLPEEQRQVTVMQYSDKNTPAAFKPVSREDYQALAKINPAYVGMFRDGNSAAVQQAISAAPPLLKQMVPNPVRALEAKRQLTKALQETRRHLE